jgi:hypothetical protein
LPKLIKVLNKVTTEKNKKKKPLKDEGPVCKGDSCILLERGDKVRVQLDVPREFVGMKRLHGKFRATDVRFDPKERVIKKVLLNPNQPALYILEGPDEVGFTKNQLQLISEKEKYPPASVVRGKPSTYVVEKILKKKKIKNKWYYQIKWMSYDETTWEPAVNIRADVPKMVAAFEGL